MNEFFQTRNVSKQTRRGASKRPERHVEAQTKPSSSQSKYRNQRTEVDGIIFASKREAARYQDLKLLERAGDIQGLVCQWRYPLEVYGTHVCFYIADFVYTTREGKSIVEDCKGMRTPIYRIKAKLMFAIYKIKILET